MMKRRWFISLSLAALTVACQASNRTGRVTPTVTLTVSVAASLQEAMAAIKPLYEQQSPEVNIVYNFGSSGALQYQIEQGAPVDIFISAAPKQMNALEKEGFLLENTRKNLLGNQIVLIVTKANNNITKFQDLTKNDVKKIALGNPKSVPAGQYAKEVLESFNLSDKLTSKFIFAKDVRQVLFYVETGNVDAGLVYATDAKISDKVKVVATAPENSHSPLIYPVAAIENSQHPEAAAAFIQFLFSESAQELFRKYGFTKSKL
jgi:molybdate transport system substrate-binding protein